MSAKTKRAPKKRATRLEDVLESVRKWYVREHWVGSKSEGFHHSDTIRLQILTTRLGHATGWMRTDKDGKPRKDLAQTQDEIADFCEKLIERVFDESVCNDACKFMYFCDKKKGHKGKHYDSGLVWD